MQREDKFRSDKYKYKRNWNHTNTRQIGIRKIKKTRQIETRQI